MRSSRPLQFLSFAALGLILSATLTSAGPVSPLAPTPNWSTLEPYQRTITRQEFARLIDQVYSRVIHHTALERMGAGLIVDLNLALIDHTAAQLDTLCENFDNGLLEEFVATD